MARLLDSSFREDSQPHCAVSKSKKAGALASGLERLGLVAGGLQTTDCTQHKVRDSNRGGRCIVRSPASNSAQRYTKPHAGVFRSPLHDYNNCGRCARSGPGTKRKTE